MKQIAENFKRIYEKEELFIEATPMQISKLEGLLGNKVCKIIDFYKNYQPYDIPMSKSYVQLLDIEGIVLENTNAEPGKYLAEYGVIVFAVTVGGNVLCIDTNSANDGDASVLIADANFCSFNESLECVEIGIVPDEIYEQLIENEAVILNYENITKCLNKIENSFMEFMLKLSNDEYEDIEEYLE